MRISLDILAKGSNDGKWDYFDLKSSVVDAVDSMLETGVI